MQSAGGGDGGDLAWAAISQDQTSELIGLHPDPAAQYRCGGAKRGLCPARALPAPPLTPSCHPQCVPFVSCVCVCVWAVGEPVYQYPPPPLVLPLVCMCMPRHWGPAARLLPGQDPVPARCGWLHGESSTCVLVCCVCFAVGFGAGRGLGVAYSALAGFVGLQFYVDDERQRIVLDYLFHHLRCSP
jgi:hypothetical protein